MVTHYTRTEIHSWRCASTRCKFNAAQLRTLYGGGWDDELGNGPCAIRVDEAVKLLEAWNAPAIDGNYWEYSL